MMPKTDGGAHLFGPGPPMQETLFHIGLNSMHAADPSSSFSPFSGRSKFASYANFSRCKVVHVHWSGTNGWDDDDEAKNVLPNTQHVSHMIKLQILEHRIFFWFNFFQFCDTFSSSWRTHLLTRILACCHFHKWISRRR